eukprot:SAG11_NODE_28827_length_317_cov_1.174312_1_plen_36_part_10
MFRTELRLVWMLPIVVASGMLEFAHQWGFAAPGQAS